MVDPRWRVGKTQQQQQQQLLRTFPGAWLWLWQQSFGWSAVAASGAAGCPGQLRGTWRGKRVIAQGASASAEHVGEQACNCNEVRRQGWNACHVLATVSPTCTPAQETRMQSQASTQSSVYTHMQTSSSLHQRARTAHGELTTHAHVHAPSVSRDLDATCPGLPCSAGL